jgi:hypothetical protein
MSAMMGGIHQSGGATGGLLVALVSSVAYIHHMLAVTTIFDASRHAEVVVFHVIGVFVGILASAQRSVTARYQRTAATLESANRELRESYEQIRRIDRLKTLGHVRFPIAGVPGEAWPASQAEVAQ